LTDLAMTKGLDATNLKHELRDTVFNFFDDDKMGELSIEQTVRCLEAFHKMPHGTSSWTSTYLMKFLDKHFSTKNGVMGRFAFDKLFASVGDGVIWGLYALHEIGVEPVSLLKLFTKQLSGRALAYLQGLFKALDQDNDAIIGPDAIEVIAMAANPWDGRAARRTQRVLSQGDSKATWRMKLDVNGDMKITMAEWVLFWGRNSEGSPLKLRKLLSGYRVFDMARLLQAKRKGQLKDRYMLLFDAMDLDSSGFVDVEELVLTLSKQPRKQQGGSYDKLATVQLRAIDQDKDGLISLSEWMTWATNRGDLDEMVAQNFHCFERSFGGPFNI